MTVYVARLLSASWRFGRWLELVIFSVLVWLIGLFLSMTSAYLAPRVTQLPLVWTKMSAWSVHLMHVGQDLGFLVFILFVLLLIVAKAAGVRVVRSNRMSKHLRRMLMTSVSDLSANQAENLVNQKANKAVRKSFVLATGRRVAVYVRVPEQVQVRAVLLGYLESVANQLALDLDMTSSTWQDVSSSLTFGNYKVMVFHN